MRIKTGFSTLDSILIEFLNLNNKIRRFDVFFTNSSLVFSLPQNKSPGYANLFYIFDYADSKSSIIGEKIINIKDFNEYFYKLYSGQEQIDIIYLKKSGLFFYSLNSGDKEGTSNITSNLNNNNFDSSIDFNLFLMEKDVFKLIQIDTEKYFNKKPDTARNTKNSVSSRPALLNKTIILEDFIEFIKSIGKLNIRPESLNLHKKKYESIKKIRKLSNDFLEKLKNYYLNEKDIPEDSQDSEYINFQVLFSFLLHVFFNILSILPLNSGFIDILFGVNSFFWYFYNNLTINKLKDKKNLVKHLKEKFALYYDSKQIDFNFTKKYIYLNDLINLFILIAGISNFIDLKNLILKKEDKKRLNKEIWFHFLQNQIYIHYEKVGIRLYFPNSKQSSVHTNITSRSNRKEQFESDNTEHSDRIFFNGKPILSLSKYSSLISLFPLKLLPNKGDILGIFYQKLMSNDSRHSSGEFYTPQKIVDAMNNYLCEKGNSFLDPSCGSGAFISDLYNKLLLKKVPNLKPDEMNKSGQKTIKNISIFGIDINPLASKIAFTSCILSYNKNDDNNSQPAIKYTIICDDSIKPSEETKKIISQVDVIIGNPPWINLSSIYSDERKKEIKLIAQEMGILFQGEENNTEFATIFFNRVLNLYLREKGLIFFIFPASVLTARQYSYFRFFSNLHNIGIWSFKQDIFRIHSICLFAQKRNFSSDLIEKVLKVFQYSEEKEIKRRKTVLREFQSFHEKRLILTFHHFNVKYNREKEIIGLKLVNQGFLAPKYIKWDEYFKKNVTCGKYPEIGRFNPLNNNSSTNKKNTVIDADYNYFAEKIPFIRSKYYKQVKGCIRFVPRRWIVVKIVQKNNDILTISPDLKQQAKKRWAIPPYKTARVEVNSVHPFINSKYLVPFCFIGSELAFFPMNDKNKFNKTKQVFSLNSMPKLARVHYNRLDSEFRKLNKDSASMKTLSDNFTYNNRLIPSVYEYSEEKKYYVVHNSIGSIVKSAVIDFPILMDNSLYYFQTSLEDEAFYLSGVLNSPIMTVLLKQVGSTGSRGSLRNIHKNPYNFPIPLFNPNNSIHREISEQSRILTCKVKKFVMELAENEEIRSKLTENEEIKSNFKNNEILNNENGFIKLNIHPNKPVRVRYIQKKLLDSDFYKKEIERLGKKVIKIF